jgi:hypothetical protein
MRMRGAVAVLAVTLSLLATACGGGDGTSLQFEEPGPPVGEPLLPDIAPAPPNAVGMRREGGKWLLGFSTVLDNVGEGDFVLRANRRAGAWDVEQDVFHSTSGAEVIQTPARLVWGGDGHGHWHVQRVAVNRLVPLDEKGKPVAGKSWADSKIGFCFYDGTHLSDTGPPEAVYSRFSCGEKDDTVIGMGLSLGWADIYPIGLPGQTIDVTDVPDGKYRMWVEADPRRWFREATRDNNVTWADIALSTKANGTREVEVIQEGPPIRGNG